MVIEVVVVSPHVVVVSLNRLLKEDKKFMEIKIILITLDQHVRFMEELVILL